MLKLIVLLTAPLAAAVAPVDPDALLSLPGDYTHMWWADGFPGHTPSAPWLRVIQTGRYAMALDTGSIRVAHLGAVSAGLSYADCARASNVHWRRLPPADLALTIAVEGRSYRCTGAAPWTQTGGPRLIESGRFLQRADVTGLIFRSDDGAALNVEARLETVAWPDRLALLLAARPGPRPIPRGEPCFGRVGGGFGLDGTNHLEIAHAPDLDPRRFTLELWTFVPADYRASPRTPPWLVCKNRHEQADGNFGIVLSDGKAQGRLNIGGGRANAFVTGPDPAAALQFERWNHLALSYDGDTLRLHVNGRAAGESRVGRERVPGRDGLAFGRRQDNCGDGYHFRGVIDEIRLHDRALSPAEIRSRHSDPARSDPARPPVRSWNFRPDVEASESRPLERWRDASMEIRLAGPDGAARRDAWKTSADQAWTSSQWREVALVAFPDSDPDAGCEPVTARAEELPSDTARAVTRDPARGWTRVDLDGVTPVRPGAGRGGENDAIERVKVALSNRTGRARVARLLFDKGQGGFRHSFGAPITGISAILRDPGGVPIGLPVQLSKNWHNRPEGGVYRGQWFHGFTLVRLPANAEVELELTLAYGHWGGLPAASHAQLCLIGWGSNQLWEQSALGAWGESICYEPDQAQAHCAILDVRPLMVRSMADDRRWSWTHNVGGGDFLRLFDRTGARVFPARMRTAYARHGPCLTEVTHAGGLGRGTGDEPTLEHAVTVSLARSDDLVRGVYRIEMMARRELDFSRFVLFQIGADTYSYTGERKMAFGDETGLAREWETRWGGDVYRTAPVEARGRIPWISLHEAARRDRRGGAGAWANRGVVIRAWDARLGGREARPWIAERGVEARGADTSTVDLLPPPDVTRLLPGDFVRATIEHVIVPQFPDDYYGPNTALRDALARSANTWRMIHREATGNDRRVEMIAGTLLDLHPAIVVRAEGGRAEFALRGGIGHVPVTFAGLSTPRARPPTVDGRPLDQGVHGNDFWQADFDPATRTWQLTFNVPVAPDTRHVIRLDPPPSIP